MGELAEEFGADAEAMRSALRESSARLARRLRLAVLLSAVCGGLVAVTYLFTDQGPYSDYWKPYGMIADVMSMMALVCAEVAIGFVWAEWSNRRGLRREFRAVQRERQGVSGR